MFSDEYEDFVPYYMRIAAKIAEPIIQVDHKVKQELGIDEQPDVGEAAFGLAIAPPRRLVLRRRIQDDESDEEPDERSDDDAPRSPRAQPAHRVVDNDDIFWDLIEQLEWRGRADGGPDNARIRAICTRWNDDQKNIFRECYNRYYDQLEFQWDLIGFFYQYELGTYVEKSAVISHAIALGRLQYNTLHDDPEFAGFIVTDNDYVSLHAILPEFAL